MIRELLGLSLSIAALTAEMLGLLVKLLVNFYTLGVIARDPK